MTRGCFVFFYSQRLHAYPSQNEDRDFLVPVHCFSDQMRRPIARPYRDERNTITSENMLSG